MNENIEKFVSRRPEVIAAYGYGSGIFKQSGYTKKDKPQIDLIFVVEDLKTWHNANIKLNRKDYSMIGKAFFKNAKIEKLKGNTGITYVSNIEEDGNVYKYGTIEEKDLLKYLDTWESFYLPGRFQKTIYPIKEEEVLSEKIKNSREKVLMLAAYLEGKTETTKKDLLVTLCGLSYLGDTRMKFAENPRKVLNIVEGSYDVFNELYDFDKEYFEVSDDLVKVNYDLIKEEINTLPVALLEYIKPYLNEEDSVIKEKILEYFANVNKSESSKQTIKGIYTNGICRSISYASKKLTKRFKK